jgi:circadian clock protein KaiC
MSERSEKRLGFGVEGLDTVVLGGLPAHHLYLLEGDPGSGKTTLALQFLLEGKRCGERGLYVTLSETRDEVAKIASSHGWSIDGLEILDLAAALGTVGEADQYTVFRPSEIELGETSERIVAEVERTKPHRVVIDSLSEIRLLAREPLRYRRQILGLKQFFASRASTVLMLDDRSAGSEDLQPRSIAHGIIELDRVPTEFGSERRRIRITKLRGSSYQGGLHDMTIVRGGVQVFPRLIASEHEGVFPSEQISTGLAELDQLMGGGLDRGTSTLITGPAGTGKSTVASSIASAALDRGGRVAIFAFEENRRIATTRATALGMSLEKHLNAGRATFRHVDPAELSPGEFAAAVRNAVEVDGASMVVIDSLNGYLNAMPEERFLTAQLHELLGYLNNLGVVTVMILVQRGMMGASAAPPVDVSYLADSIVLLRHFEAFGAVRKAVSVVKKRSGSHEDTIRELRFEAGGLRVGEVLSHFHGVLTGVPQFVGKPEDLLKEKRA